MGKKQGIDTATDSSLSPREERVRRELERGASKSLFGESRAAAKSASSPPASPPLRGREGEKLQRDADAAGIEDEDKWEFSADGVWLRRIEGMD